MFIHVGIPGRAKLQLIPSPLKPMLHMHVKLPIVLVQVALSSQLLRPTMHSSISACMGWQSTRNELAIVESTIYYDRQQYRNSLYSSTKNRWVFKVIRLLQAGFLGKQGALPAFQKLLHTEKLGGLGDLG